MCAEFLLILLEKRKPACKKFFADRVHLVIQSFCHLVIVAQFEDCSIAKR